MTTAPLSIRFYETADAPALFEAARESIAEIHPWLPWCHPGYALEEAQAWVTQQVELRAASAEFQFVICGAGGRFLGGCGLNQLDLLHQRANLGYWVRTAETGHGVAPAAVRELVRWAFECTELRRLEVVAALGNLRSQRVAEKAGAEREGVLRSRLLLHGLSHDAVLYAFVR